MSCVTVHATKTMFINAKIYDGENFIDADSFVVDQGRFLQIGSISEIQPLIAPEDSIVDLKGARVLPGFIEAHAHLLGLGQSMLNLDLRNLQPDQIIELVKKQATIQLAGSWIKGRGWDQNLWPSKTFPDVKMLRSIAKHPVYLRRVDGHAAWVNDQALAIAGINKNTPDPVGGRILRNSLGEPTGILIDHAMDLVNSYVDTSSKKELEHHLELGIKKALSMGICSFHDAGANRAALDLFSEYAKSNRLDLRIFAMIDGEDQNLVDEYLKTGPKTITDFLTIRTIKYFADGALGSRGALLIDDYHDQPGSRGLSLSTEKQLFNQTSNALKAGFQVATHAIGDQANRMVLNAYERALSKVKSLDARLRVEHAQLVDPIDHIRFKNLSIIASMQPVHCTSDMAWVPDRLGSARLKDRAYPWRSLLNKGAVLAFGSDAPVESINPIEGLYAAVSRSSANSETPFMPEQQLTMKQALSGFYSGAAFAEFNEHQKGKISPGYFADFVVFNDDILHLSKSSFLKAEPVMTVVGGKIVFKR